MDADFFSALASSKHRRLEALIADKLRDLEFAVRRFERRAMRERLARAERAEQAAPSAPLDSVSALLSAAVSELARARDAHRAPNLSAQDSLALEQLTQRLQTLVDQIAGVMPPAQPPPPAAAQFSVAQFQYASQPFTPVYGPVYIQPAYPTYAAPAANAPASAAQRAEDAQPAAATSPRRQQMQADQELKSVPQPVQHTWPAASRQAATPEHARGTQVAPARPQAAGFSSRTQGTVPHSYPAAAQSQPSPTFAAPVPAAATHSHSGPRAGSRSASRLHSDTSSASFYDPRSLSVEPTMRVSPDSGGGRKSHSDPASEVSLPVYTKSELRRILQSLEQPGSGRPKPERASSRRSHKPEHAGRHRSFDSDRLSAPALASRLNSPGSAGMTELENGSSSSLPHLGSGLGSPLHSPSEWYDSARDEERLQRVRARVASKLRLRSPPYPVNSFRGPEAAHMPQPEYPSPAADHTLPFRVCVPSYSADSSPAPALSPSLSSPEGFYPDEEPQACEEPLVPWPAVTTQPLSQWPQPPLEAGFAPHLFAAGADPAQRPHLPRLNTQFAAAQPQLNAVGAGRPDPSPYRSATVEQLAVPASQPYVCAQPHGSRPVSRSSSRVPQCEEQRPVHRPDPHLNDQDAPARIGPSPVEPTAAPRVSAAPSSPEARRASVQHPVQPPASADTTVASLPPSTLLESMSLDTPRVPNPDQPSRTANVPEPDTSPRQASPQRPRYVTAVTQTAYAEPVPPRQVAPTVQPVQSTPAVKALEEFRQLLHPSLTSSPPSCIKSAAKPKRYDDVFLSTVHDEGDPMSTPRTERTLTDHSTSTAATNPSLISATTATPSQMHGAKARPLASAVGVAGGLQKLRDFHAVIDKLTPEQVQYYLQVYAAGNALVPDSPQRKQDLGGVLAELVSPAASESVALTELERETIAHLRALAK